jgi:hypothetical protein
MRYSRILSVLTATALVVVACSGESDPVGGETPADPDTSTTFDSHDVEPRPLPPATGQRDLEELPNMKYRHWPNSAPIGVDVPYIMTVGTHCGFGPIDFDGSFWEPDPSANTNNLDDPEDTGVITLESEDRAIYLTSKEIDIGLTRMTDEYIDLDPCM